MKTSERNLWISVGVVVVVGLAINSLMGLLNSPVLNNTGNISFESASRLLRSSQNIKARNKAVGDFLKMMEARFYSINNKEEAQINLLKTVETIANSCNLDVQQKNVPDVVDNIVQVSLEGKTKPDTLIRFIQSTTAASTGLRIQRLQIHSLSDQKLLSYQLVVISLLIEKGK